MLDEVIISKLKNKKIENVCGIYVILNIITNKVYIGSSVAIRSRKNKYIKKNIPLSNFCGKGHEYTEENTVVYFKGSLKCRKCKKCKYEYNKIYKRKNSKKSSDKDKTAKIRTHCKRGHVLTEKCLVKKSCCQCIKIAASKYARSKRQQLRGVV